MSYADKVFKAGHAAGSHERTTGIVLKGIPYPFDSHDGRMWWAGYEAGLGGKSNVRPA